jgi:hypothetical protein
MPRTAHHIYYRVGDDEILILSVWGARKARSPKV